MDKTDRLRDYGLAFLLYEHGLGVCGYELIRELFIFIKLILNSYLIRGKDPQTSFSSANINKKIDINVTSALKMMFYNTKKICVKQITQIFFKLLLIRGVCL